MCACVQIEFEQEYNASFENPDIEETPPMSLEEVLEKVKPFVIAYEGIRNEDEWQVSVVRVRYMFRQVNGCASR